MVFDQVSFKIPAQCSGLQGPNDDGKGGKQGKRCLLNFKDEFDGLCNFNTLCLNVRKS